MALAYGKVILVGEHAVVYGIPAIAVGVGVAATASARIAQQSSLTIGIRRWDLGRLEPEAAREAPTAEARAFRELIAAIGGSGGTPPEIEAEVQLHQPSGVGLGASAAIGVALARAVSDALGAPSAQRSAAEILAAAGAWENVFHGKASGVDAATAYHGGCLWFRPGEPPEPLRIQRALRLAVAVAGPAVSTRLMVESVAAFRSQNPQRFELVLQSIHALVQEARVALLLGRQDELGALLDRNHRLVSDLGVSTPGLDAACQQARAAGALGAKLTGGGGGGCVLALTEAESSERVLAAWRQQGLHCFEASVPGADPSNAAAGAGAR
jgi:mevalonate kinase